MAAVTDIRAYSTLETDNEPRLLIRTDDNQISLDDGSMVAALNGTSKGVFFIPHRPNQSPQSWMYVAAAEDYRKLSAPDALDQVINYKVGIKEPQQPPEAAPSTLGYRSFTAHASDWTPGGVAGAITEALRVNDTIGKIIKDPVFTAGLSRFSLEVGATKYYQVTQEVEIDPYGNIQTIVQDVIPPINQGNPLEIDRIYYFTGTTGRCVIVPKQTVVGGSIPSMDGNNPIADSIFTATAMAGLRRGALLRLTDYDGSPFETVFVLSVTRGPEGSICFECDTVGSFQAGDKIIGLPTIIVEHFAITPAMNEGDPITSQSRNFSLSGAGVGFVSQPFPSASVPLNPFTEALGNDNFGSVPQLDDYLVFAINMSDISKLVVGRIIFNVGDVVDYSTDVFYSEFRISDLVKQLQAQSLATLIPTFEEFLRTRNATTIGPEERNKLQNEYQQLYGNAGTIEPTGDTSLYPSDTWYVTQMPIRGLQWAGKNKNRTLANCNGVRLLFQTTGAIDIKFSSMWLGGGGQPDTGRVGSPYFYIVRGRSTATGAKSNPSPMTRYGISPRRQRGVIEWNDTTGDPQTDMFDIFRYGGTITSWRYIGSSPNTGFCRYFDNLFDTSVINQQTATYDDFEPWPSVDLPFHLMTDEYNTAEFIGTALRIEFAMAADVPVNITRWLPGTEMLVNNRAFTLWTRPTMVTATAVLIRTVENMGAGDVTSITIQEPLVGNQKLPYVFGPDANGTVFAVGDPLRPGVLYYSKTNDPDSVPDTYNREITPPSEPLLGGIIMNGVAYVASSARWWALYPAFGNVNPSERYQVVERPIGRGLAAPYGLTTDGKLCWFWAKDGIWVHEGASGKSLTDDDLRNIFPREGVNGNSVEYAGHVIHAPDYKHVTDFRLAYHKGYLYADYVSDDTEDVPNEAGGLSCGGG